MNWQEIDLEFYLLSEYMNIYIQILPNCVGCGGKILHKQQLPTFEYFKKTYMNPSYSLIIPHFKESKTIYEDRIGSVSTHGIGSTNGIAYRYYNLWMGCKFFVNDMDGNYTVERELLNKIIKQLK